MRLQRLRRKPNAGNAPPTPDGGRWKASWPRISARRSGRDWPARAVAVACELGPTILRCDGFAVTRLLERLALDWAGQGAGELTLTLASEGAAEAVVSLEARGDVPDSATVAGWLKEPLSPGMTGFTGAAVCVAHGTSVAPEPAGPGRAALRFALPLARPEPSRPYRTVLYDFDLLNADIPDDLCGGEPAGPVLRGVRHRTTGLNPQVDEVCQIAAVRVVNGKLVEGERFDMLVNPGRKIPAASTAVHQITDAMVGRRPRCDRGAGAVFHTFADGAVLVAHNCALRHGFPEAARARDRAAFRPAHP